MFQVFLGFTFFKVRLGPNMMGFGIFVDFQLVDLYEFLFAA